MGETVKRWAAGIDWGSLLRGAVVLAVVVFWIVHAGGQP
jgi:hypothetical protein